MISANRYRFVYSPFPHPTRILALARTFRDRDKKLISERVVKILDSNGVEVKKSTLYFAAPLDVSPETPTYRTALLAAQQRWPFHTIFEPLTQDWDTAARSEIWPDILPTIDTLTVLPRRDGSIGKGCYREIVDCRERGIQVLIFIHNVGEFHPFEKVCRVSSQRRNPDFYAFAYPHSRPGYWDYADDELSKVWVESNSEKTGIKSCLN